MRHAAQLSASSVHLDEEVLAEPPIGMMLLSRKCQSTCHEPPHSVEMTIGKYIWNPLLQWGLFSFFALFSLTYRAKIIPDSHTYICRLDVESIRNPVHSHIFHGPCALPEANSRLKTVLSSLHLLHFPQWGVLLGWLDQLHFMRMATLSFVYFPHAVKRENGWHGCGLHPHLRCGVIHKLISD